MGNFLEEKITVNNFFECHYGNQKLVTMVSSVLEFLSQKDVEKQD